MMEPHSCSAQHTVSVGRILLLFFFGIQPHVRQVYGGSLSLAHSFILSMQYKIQEKEKYDDKKGTQNTSCTVKGHMENLNRRIKTPSTFGILDKSLGPVTGLGFDFQVFQETKRFG
ncbi:hypothetical protein BGZ60DRAFT_19843 [Tricladium varicosporioides]|nr:hypothetical protein BGZ60DRAFT_19843 [Hymenoscyphus varicosporioides]